MPSNPARKLLASASVLAVSLTAATLAVATDTSRPFQVAQGQPVSPEEAKRRQDKAKADADRAKAAQDAKGAQDRGRAAQDKAAQDKAAQDRAKGAQDRAKAEGDRARRAQDEKQRQDRARFDAERQKQDRTKADADRAKGAQDEKQRQDRAKFDAERQKRDFGKGDPSQKRDFGKGDANQKRDFGKGDPGPKGDVGKADADRFKQTPDQKQRADNRPVRLDQVQKERQRRVEAGGRVVIEEPGKRFIVKDQGRAFIRHDESERFRLVTRNARTERRGNLTVNIFSRPDGTQVYSEVDDQGRLLRRYRRTRDGREVVLIDNRRIYRPGQGFVNFVVSLAPPVIRIPRERYIVDYSRASDEDIYETLMAPPVEEFRGGYTLEEIRYSYALRDRMRRVDLDEINFEFGSWEITEDQMPKLARLGRILNRILDRNPNEVFLIQGFTDAVGSEEDNLSLSDRRAESIAVILSERFDIPPENLATQGYGEQFLKVDTQGPERLNRRVAVQRVTPLMGEPRLSDRR